MATKAVAPKKRIKVATTKKLTAEERLERLEGVHAVLIAVLHDHGIHLPTLDEYWEDPDSYATFVESNEADAAE